ncbi:hypothetical protein [Neolewinella antarctica]|uniref:Integral membrane protein n=1 Tax=Neolewinella antarctica TaxID=442734 RepID=A0ABX0XE10_9BACT|nr:hypothetical protein [Neolewinella antarctica]NJC27551.1 hypothetical protein [Neolewinella antarctica]
MADDRTGRKRVWYFLEMSYLFNRDIAVAALAVLLLLLYPVYNAGLWVVPSTAVTYVLILLLLLYFNYQNKRIQTVFYKNINLRPRHLMAVFLVICWAVYLLASFLTILLVNNTVPRGT